MWRPMDIRADGLQRRRWAEKHALVVAERLACAAGVDIEATSVTKTSGRPGVVMRRRHAIKRGTSMVNRAGGGRGCCCWQVGATATGAQALCGWVEEEAQAAEQAVDGAPQGAHRHRHRL